MHLRQPEDRVRLSAENKAFLARLDANLKESHKTELPSKTRAALKFALAAFTPALWRSFIPAFCVDSFVKAGLDGGLRRLYGALVNAGGEDRVSDEVRQAMLSNLPRALMWIGRIWGRPEDEDFEKWGRLGDAVGDDEEKEGFPVDVKDSAKGKKGRGPLERNLQARPCSWRACVLNPADEGSGALLWGKPERWMAWRQLSLDTMKVGAEAKRKEREASREKAKAERLALSEQLRHLRLWDAEQARYNKAQEAAGGKMAKARKKAEERYAADWHKGEKDHEKELQSLAAANKKEVAKKRAEAAKAEARVQAEVRACMKAFKEDLKAESKRGRKRRAAEAEAAEVEEAAEEHEEPEEEPVFSRSGRRVRKPQPR